MAQKRTVHDAFSEEEIDEEASKRFAPKQRISDSPGAHPGTGITTNKNNDEGKFKLMPPSRESKPSSVEFQKPYQLISFSYTPERRLVFDDSALRYWVEPPRHADLGHRFSHWIRRPEERGRIDSLLEAISQPRCEEARKKQGLVVCWRGVLCKILVAPYEEQDSWDLNVMLINDILYFEEHVSDERLREKEDMNPRQREQTYYGYSFESWCTAERPRQPGETPRWGGDVDTNVQWCSVVKGKLGTHRLLIGGEVDCVRDTYTGQPDTFVELKTSISIRHGNLNDELRFEKKLLKFYFQSFLLGVPEIVVGFRNPRGQLQTLQPFKTLQIPRMVRGKQGEWNPNVCLSWGQSFITKVKQWMEDADNVKTGTTHVGRLRFSPRAGVHFRLLNDLEKEEVQNGDDREGFLPRWYMNDGVGSSS
ncbi:decapping endonuclease targeting mRNA [Serendipita sp. 398]|nr:decapping endonuclease targeting mRNA [Serendipita sp. 398]